MIHFIENNYLQVSIQHKGAEICSIQSKTTNIEYMWNANPDVWGSYAPVLFPVIGSLKNNSYTYKGENYSVPKHGFIRNNNNLQVVLKTVDSLTLEYKYDEETLKMFPFKFVFSIAFQLIDNKLEVKHKVENLGNEEMFFSLGAHPGFKCPIHKHETYEDYYIQFEEKEFDRTWELSKNGLTTGKTHSVLNNTDKLPLTKSLFSADALIFKSLKSNKVSLMSRHNRYKISLNFADFNYLGLWAKPSAPFICIEPWLGITDDENCSGKLEEKEGIRCLDANSIFSAKYQIEIHE